MSEISHPAGMVGGDSIWKCLGNYNKSQSENYSLKRCSANEVIDYFKNYE